MLEEITEDRSTVTPVHGSPMFRSDVDYDQLLNDRQTMLQRWLALPPSERTKYKSESAYLAAEGQPDLKDPDLIPAKNMSLLVKEIRERTNGPSDVLQLLPLDAIDVDDGLLELAESLENVPDIRELYRLRKRATGTTKNAGINADEAARLKNCYTQGRELYLAGRQGSLMVKPLNFFYALTAYTYGIIILNNPLRYGKGNIPGSHGMTYLPDVVQAQFGGDSPRGTFSDLVTSFPTQLVKTPLLEIQLDCNKSITEYYDNRVNVSLGTLLSMVPEMSEYYKLTTGRNSRCHRIEVVSGTNPRSLTWDFHIGDGEVRPSNDSVELSFPGLHRAERQGKIVVAVPASAAASMPACIYTDIWGELWFVENPLITNVFSNIMRYRPDQWGNVLLNEVSSGISLLTRHYFSSFQKKFFFVVLRSLSRYLPYAA